MKIGPTRELNNFNRAVDDHFGPSSHLGQVALRARINPNRFEAFPTLVTRDVAIIRPHAASISNSEVEQHETLETAFRIGVAVLIFFMFSIRH